MEFNKDEDSTIGEVIRDYRTRVGGWEDSVKEDDLWESVIDARGKARS